MSLLKDLIPGYENMDEEELNQIIMTGRIAREEQPKTAKSSPRKQQTVDLGFDADDFE